MQKLEKKIGSCLILAKTVLPSVCILVDLGESVLVFRDTAKNVHYFLMTSWACDPLAEMLLIIKKTIFDLINGGQVLVKY